MADLGSNCWRQWPKIHTDTSRETQSNRCGRIDDFTSQDGPARLVFQFCFTNCYHIATCSAAKLVIDLFWIGVLCKKPLWYRASPLPSDTNRSTKQNNFSWNIFWRWWPVRFILNGVFAALSIRILPISLPQELSVLKRPDSCMFYIQWQLSNRSMFVERLFSNRKHVSRHQWCAEHTQR